LHYFSRTNVKLLSIFTIISANTMINRLKRKWLHFFITASGLLLFNCNKPDKAHSPLVQATVTGFNNRVCFGGQGVALTFNGETQPMTGIFYVADNTPDELGISSNENFPLQVDVDTSNVLQNCTYPVVHLKKMVKR
jgi:hypothetical protein